ncbi:MAG: phosphomethylpyrimidine synthase ThiC [Promethearchaeia archaeon]
MDKKQDKDLLQKEPLSKKALLDGIAKGKIVLLRGGDIHHTTGLGDGLKTKLLCNLGTSSEDQDISKVIEIAQEAEKFGASIICDQSTGPRIMKNRRKLINSVNLPIASIPFCQNVEDSLRHNNNPLEFSTENVLKVFEEQIKSGISAPGIHPITKSLINKIDDSTREGLNMNPRDPQKKSSKSN